MAHNSVQAVGRRPHDKRPLKKSTTPNYDVIARARSGVTFDLDWRLLIGSKGWRPHNNVQAVGRRPHDKP